MGKSSSIDVLPCASIDELLPLWGKGLFGFRLKGNNRDVVALQSERLGQVNIVPVEGSRKNGGHP